VTFSSKVTARRAIPNSFDGSEHAAYRAVVDRYLTDERVGREEPQCRDHAAAIIDALPRGVTVKTIATIGTPYAVRSQSTWPGWPADLEDTLVAWIHDNHAAARSGDRDMTRDVADSFDSIIRGLLDERRSIPAGDVTSELLAETVDGRPLTDDEIVSILRNWTAGDLGSLATSVDVLGEPIHDPEDPAQAGAPLEQERHRCRRPVWRRHLSIDGGSAQDFGDPEILLDIGRREALRCCRLGDKCVQIVGLTA
jgi:hypothetical protein